MPVMQTFTLYPHKDYLKDSQLFESTYNLVDAFLPGRTDLKNLKPKHERTCRFCGKTNGETTFQSEAHLIPESLGNKELLSDFECDLCNYQFGNKYDNELSNFLGIYRTLNGTKGKEGIPGFTAPNKVIKAKGSMILDEETIVISRENVENGAIVVDKEKGLITIKYKKNAFSPLGVYKSILKIALSIISDAEVKQDYQFALDYLMAKGNVMLTGCLMNGYALPFNCFPFPPHALLFKKKDPAAKTHTHVVVLYFQNMILALPVPLNINDIHLYKEMDASKLPFYPPFMPVKNPGSITVRGFVEDFSSEEKLRGVEDEIFIELDPKELANSRAYDSISDQVHDSEFNPSEIIQIVIRRNGKNVNPQELVKALNQLQKR